MNFGRRPSRASSSSSASSSVDAHPVGVDLHLERLGLVRAEDGHRARVGRRLGDHHVARVDQRLRHQVDRLLAAGGDDDVVEVGVHALGRHHLADALLGLGEALGRPVLERLGRALLRDPGHLRGEALGREGRRVGQAAGERDHLRSGGDLHQVAHRAGAHHLRALPRTARRSARDRGRWCARAGAASPPLHRWAPRGRGARSSPQCGARPGRGWPASPTRPLDM